jgi:selenide,water dikinase
VLRDLPHFHDPRVLAGEDMADDAGVFRLTDDLALVQSIDFFTPVVDDPHTYGQIAAANAFSDIYAMGGTPLTALNVAVFPSKTLPMPILSEIMRGGAEKAAEAGVAIIGGHTVDGDEPMYGLSVTGVVDPDRLVRPSGGAAGDALVLTKPLGTGVVATALKAGFAKASHVAEAVRWMSRLNRTAAEAMKDADAHASTDITGFGLLGHLSEMARASGLAVELDAAAVPAMSGAAEYGEAGFVPRGGVTNREYSSSVVTFAASVPEHIRILLNDPQTSGGLVIALPQPQSATLCALLQASGDAADRVGRLVEGQPGHIHVAWQDR